MTEILRHIRTGGLYEVLFRGARVRAYNPRTDYDLVLIAQHVETGEVGAWSTFGSIHGGWTLLLAAVVQTNAPLGDGAEVVIYRALKGGPVWVRPTSEMDDGRFVHADAVKAPDLKALQIENDHLRASLANSGGPCVYCALPRERWGECADGFPGCARGDDAMLCPHVGAELGSQEEIDALRILLRRNEVRIGRERELLEETTRLLGRARAAEAENTRMREALAPFAAAADAEHMTHVKDYQRLFLETTAEVVITENLRGGHFRAARTALKNEERRRG